MGLRDTFRELLYGPTKQVWSPEFVAKQLSDPSSLVGTLERLTGRTRATVWRRVSVREALGVPAIQRAVSLIASTTGMLSVQGYRDGLVMDGKEGRPSAPSLITRPDPYETPGAFYGGTAGDMAKYGEFCWWIAGFDGDGQASALVRVPLNELQVTENQKNRLLPAYRWGDDKTGTRYSGANRDGRFVHVKYQLAEPFQLRGEGPLQLCGVANSVAVESQNWAGNFYGEGGHPATIIKKAGLLSPTLLDPATLLPDPAGQSEADILRNQVIGRANNTAMVIDDGIESIEYKEPNTVGAQMLDARQFNNGDAAREFGIPGPLLEYQQPGGSLTYQNRTELKGALLETCLMPIYLEPIEQAMSDLLTRSTVARFNVKGFLRADIRTRFDVYKIAIEAGIYGPEYAQREEGIIPGDVEYAPVPFAAPAAIPSALPRTASLTVDWRCRNCDAKLLEVAGPGSRATCRRCKTANAIALDEAAPEQRLEIHNHFPPDFVRVESPVTVHQPDIHLEPTFHAAPSGPLTVQVEPPETQRAIAEVGEQVALLSAGMVLLPTQADADALRARLDELATNQADLAATLAAPRKKRQYTFERDEDNKIIRVIEAA